MFPYIEWGMSNYGNCYDTPRHSQLEDTLEEPSPATLYRLSGGSSYLLVTSKSGKSKQVELRGHIRDVSFEPSARNRILSLSTFFRH